MSGARAQLAPVLDAGGPRVAGLLERTEVRLREVASGHASACHFAPWTQWPAPSDSTRTTRVRMW